MPNPFGLPSINDVAQFGSDALSYLPDALKGSAAGTLGMPVDLYQLLTNITKPNVMMANPDAAGGSNWFGQLFGANTQSPSFDIARMTAMAPPMIGGMGKLAKTALGVGDAAGAALKPISMQELQMLQGSSSNAVQRALGEVAFHAKNGNVDHAVNAMEEARNAYAATDAGKEYAKLLELQNLLKGP